MDKPQVIIMDDDIDYANFIGDITQSLGFKSTIINDADDFMRQLSSEISLILMDLNIPNIDGIELLRFIENKHCRCNIILMSGADARVIETAEAFAQSIGLSVVGQFQKTIRLAELEALLKKCVYLELPQEEVPVENPKLEFTVTKEELIRAIKNNEFVIYYQPKIEIATRGFYGVEALVRWMHPVHRLIFPDEFIGLAESFGLIDDLSWIIFKTAFKEIGELQAETRFPFKLSLNLSSHSLKDRTFPDKFISCINQYNVSSENIILEITESGLVKELSDALEIFTRLRLNNIQLSIDDFGTGYAMMKQLKIVPATEIKIDKSFVLNMFIDNSALVTVKKVIEIGHELRMKVVAEGVETKEHLLFLQSQHCDIAQGYYFSKPIPITALKTWIDDKYKFSS